MLSIARAYSTDVSTSRDCMKSGPGVGVDGRIVFSFSTNEVLEKSAWVRPVSPVIDGNLTHMAVTRATLPSSTQ